MAQGKSPRNPLAFAFVLYPGRCLASQPIHLGTETREPREHKGPCPKGGRRVIFTPAPASRGRASADAPETRNYARVDCPVVVILGQVALVLLRLHFCYR